MAKRRKQSTELVERAQGVPLPGQPPIRDPVALIGDGVIGREWSPDWWQRGWQGEWRGGLPIVEACIAAYSQTVAQCTPNHKRKMPNGAQVILTDTPLAKLLRRPNDYQTSSDLMMNLERSLQATGNAYVYTPRNAGIPQALHLLNPRKVRFVRSAEDWSTYFYKLDGGTPADAPFDPVNYLAPREMLHIRLNIDTDPLIGISPLMHAANALALNRQIGTSLSAFYTNMSRPAGVLTTEERLTSEQTAKLRAAFDNQAKGMQVGNVPILTNGLKWVPLGFTAQEAEVIAAYKESVVDIARVFRVPLQMINEMEQATFNNAETLINFWLSTGLGFAINHIELAFDAHFDLPADEYTELDTDVLMRTDTPARLDALAKAVAGGIYSPNEARRVEGLPDAVDGDEPRMQQQDVPLSAYAEQAKIAADKAANPPPMPPQLALPPPANDPAAEGALKALFDATLQKGVSSAA